MVSEHFVLVLAEYPDDPDPDPDPEDCGGVPPTGAVGKVGTITGSGGLSILSIN